MKQNQKNCSESALGGDGCNHASYNLACSTVVTEDIGSVGPAGKTQPDVRVEPAVAPSEAWMKSNASSALPYSSASINVAGPMKAILSVANAGVKRDSTKAIVRSIVHVICSFHPQWTDKQFGRIKRSFEKMARRISLMEESVEQSYVKYHNDELMAKCGDDMVTYPRNEFFDSVPLYPGYLGRLVQRRLLRRDFRFFYSLQKGSKQSWPKLPQSCLVKALDKHESLICGERAPDVDPERDLAVAAASREVFKTFQLTAKFTPSGSACLQHKRDEGGTGKCVLRFKPETFREIGTLAGNLHSFERHRKLEFDLQGDRLRKAAEIAVEAGKESGVSPHDCHMLNSVSVSVLPEPGKFRTLSKGHGDLYTQLQPIQGGMLQSWKDLPYSTMRGEDLLPRLQEIEDKSPFPTWVSGDYSSATDTLSREVSLLAATGLPDAERRLAQFSLLPGGVISYPKVKEGPGKYAKVLRPARSLPQRNGQLMGHVLSFPLLCVENLATYRLAQTMYVQEADWGSYEYETRQQEMLVSEELVVINGDDIVFKANAAFFDCFNRAAKRVGFVPSPGKNYFSNTMCQINSQLYSIREKRLRREGYLSGKLIFGTNIKDGGEKSGATPVELGREFSRLSEFCPQYRHSIALALSRFKDTYGHVRPNWFLPVHLGGFGFSTSESFDLTKQQRRLAAQCVNEPSKTLYRLRKEGLMNENPIEVPRARVALNITPYVPEVWETELTSQMDSRLMLMDRWTQFSYLRPEDRHFEEITCPPPKSDRVPAHLSINHRYKPMSDERLKEYWNAQYLRINRGIAGAVPPLGALRTKFVPPAELCNGVCMCN